MRLRTEGNNFSSPSIFRKDSHPVIAKYGVGEYGDENKTKSYSEINLNNRIARKQNAQYSS